MENITVIFGDGVFVGDVMFAMLHHEKDRHDQPSAMRINYA
jgi:hypothetical protein